ncbi:MAG: multicopper oxidase domain-containing protein [Candidatus Thermoplasmatota archaeon]
MKALYVSLVLVAATLAGCAGSNSSNLEPLEPGTRFTETGKTVHLRMWVVDLEEADIYPGLKANLWAFCAEPADATDAYSLAAIEYREQSGNVPEESKGKCSVPGPTLRVNQGDRVIVDFENRHVHPHTIHWHGQLVPYKSDGTPGVNQDSVKPGDTYRYEFIAKKAGTLWYHCHVDTQFHVMQGLYGGFIVEPQDKSAEPEGVDRDYLHVLGTAKRSLIEAIPATAGTEVDPHAQHRAGGGCGVTGEQGCQNPAVDVTPDVFMINGKSAPLTDEDPLTALKMAEGETIRLRILNAGTTVETIHPHGHDMFVTHRDGSPLVAPFYVDVLTIGPAERYDVVFQANNPGSWILHTHVNNHETNCGASPGGMEAPLVYTGFESEYGAYKAELPAGCGYVAPVELPADLLQEFHAELSSTPTVMEPEAVFTFPVDGCAVRTLRFSLAAQADMMALQAGNSLVVTLRDADGAALATETLGAQAFVSWSKEFPEAGIELPHGNYTLSVKGRAIATSIDATVQVDYYETVEQLKEAGGDCAAHPE